mgnify:CR=1 FL=1
MKKNMKKLFALLLAALMVCTIFAGCAKPVEKPNTDQPQNPTENTENPPEETKDPVEPAAPAEKHENKVVYGSQLGAKTVLLKDDGRGHHAGDGAAVGGLQP